MQSTEPDRKNVTGRDKIPAEKSDRYFFLRWYMFFSWLSLQMVTERDTTYHAGQFQDIEAVFFYALTGERNHT